MTRNQAREEIRERFSEYLRPAKKKGTYICPLCGNGTGSTGDGIVVDTRGDNKHLKCFKCGFYGDIIKLYQQENNCSTGEAFSALYNYFGIQVDRELPASAPVKEEPAPDLDTNKSFRDYTKYYEEARKHLREPAAVAYLEKRGISLETATQFWIGFDPDWVSPTAIEKMRSQGKDWTPPATPRLIIPTGPYGYTARSTQENTDPRYRKMKEGTAGIFGEKALRNSDGRPIFVVEGEIDALSIIEVGAEAVALGSTSNKIKLLEYLKKRKPSGPLIISMDNDDAGKKAATELADGLHALGITYVFADVSGDHKDPNERLQTDRDGFIKAVEEAEHSASSKPDAVGYYLSRLMTEEINRFQEGANRQSGFVNLDSVSGGIYPGLYVLGAISSLGKTTFIHQIGDQLAAAGEHVLYFSLEQSRLEMVSKSLSRLTAQRDINTAKTSLSIRTGHITPAVLKAADTYTATAGDRMSIIEGNFDCTVAAIKEYVGRYMDRNNVKPVVIVDYLQIIQSDTQQYHNSKELVDSNVTELKRLSRGRNIPVFIVSSINRSNYLTPIDFESFKESGGIEYTADVVWGLQLEVLNDELFSKEGKIKEKREKIKEAKAAIPRRIELVCLKNRYGSSSYKASFDYFPQYDLFQATEPQNNTPVRRL